MALNFRPPIVWPLRGPDLSPCDNALWSGVGGISPKTWPWSFRAQMNRNFPTCFWCHRLSNAASILISQMEGHDPSLWDRRCPRLHVLVLPVSLTCLLHKYVASTSIIFTFLRVTGLPNDCITYSDMSDEASCRTISKFRPGNGKGVVILCFNWAPRREGVLGEWKCSSTHSWPRH
jgi:hypothetical protein